MLYVARVMEDILTLCGGERWWKILQCYRVTKVVTVLQCLLLLCPPPQSQWFVTFNAGKRLTESAIIF